MTTPPEPAPDASQEAAAAPSWLDILGAAAVAVGFAAWGYQINAQQGLQAALGPLAIALWTAGFAALRFASRRRIMLGLKPTTHTANLERAHAFAGAMLFTFLGVISARNGQWLPAAGLLVAAIVFGIGGARPRSAT